MASQTEAQRKTAELLTTNGSTLIQPMFDKDGLLAAIDVLQFDGAPGTRFTKSNLPPEFKTNWEVEQDQRVTITA